MKKTVNTKKLVLLALFTALIIILAFTPIGYLKLGFVSITFLCVPVVVGSILTGVGGGLYLGAVFGFTSFFQCFGYDAFGTTLFDINPFYTFIMCLVPRLLVGLFSALIFKGIKKISKGKILPFALASLGGALTNTVFFVGIMTLCFGQTEFIKENLGDFFTIVKVLVVINGLSEAVVCCFIGTILSKAIITATTSKHSELS